MTTLDTRPEDVRDPEASATWRPLGWRQTLLMNFGPAAITFAAVLALAPLPARLGLPRYFSFTVAEALVLTPIELGLLLRAAHRATGRWSLRALAAGDVNKNDPNDARSVAVAALRSAGVREVRADDHAMVLKIWSKRYRDLGRTRTQAVCRRHAVLGELIPGGVPKVITVSRAARVLRAIRPQGAVQAARCELAAAVLEDLHRIDAGIRETRTKLAVTVAAARASLTGLFGVGPVIAAAVIGDVRDVSRFPGRDHFAACNETAPIEVSGQAESAVGPLVTAGHWRGTVNDGGDADIRSRAAGKLKNEPYRYCWAP